MALDDYTPGANGEGDRVKPSDIVGHPLIVKILARKEGIITEYSPSGAPGVTLNVIDLADTPPTLYRDVLWMNGALVDNLTPNVGKTIAVKLVWVKAKSGRDYLSLEPADDQEKVKATAYLAAVPDPWQALDEPTVDKTTGEIAQPAAAAPAPAAPAASVAIDPEKLTADQRQALVDMGIAVPA